MKNKYFLIVCFCIISLHAYSQPYYYVSTLYVNIGNTMQCNCSSYVKMYATSTIGPGGGNTYAFEWQTYQYGFFCDPPPMGHCSYRYDYVSNGITTRTFTPTANGKYRCLVKILDASLNVVSSSYTGYVDVYLNTAVPVVTSYPADISDKCVGSSVTLTVAASEAVKTYTWYRRPAGTANTWVAVTGEQATPEYTFTTTVADDNYEYSCILKNACGTSNTHTNPGVLTLKHPPAVLNHPQNKTVCPYTGTSFRVDPVKPVSVTNYQWQMKPSGGNWSNVSGTIFSGINSQELVLTSITPDYNNYSFQCVLSGDCSPSATSNAASLTVISAPVISAQPAGKAICEGAVTSLTVTASGQPTLQYRWKKGGVNITDWSTSPVLNFDPVRLTDQADYMVTIKDGCGTVIESNSATLTVNPKPTVSLGADKHLCPGEYLTLNPGTGYSSYLWSTGATTQTIQVSAQGSYTVTVTNDKGCSNQSSVFVTLDPAIPAPDLGADAEICQGQAKLLDASDQYDVYLWNTGSTNSSILVNTTGTYWVEVRRNISVCIKRDSVDVFVQKPYEDEEICMVLIDPETEKNMIVWEKTEDVNTMKYQVYKKTGTTYTLVQERMFADSA